MGFEIARRMTGTLRFPDVPLDLARLDPQHSNFKICRSGPADVADIRSACDDADMYSLARIGALDIAEAISERIGSYVDMNFMQFLAVENDRISCWYMNSSGEGPTFAIEIMRVGDGWFLELTEHPPGTEQEVEVP